jgi:DNA-binding HxlR family transcriptional regulator
MKDTKPMRERNYECHFGCPVEATLDVIGGKWKGVILYHLLDGTQRFGVLRRLLPDVTPRMLTLQLRELEADGIVERTVYAEVPPRVEYRLTPFGESLRPVIVLLRDWGATYVDTLRERRRALAALASCDSRGNS